MRCDSLAGRRLQWRRSGSCFQPAAPTADRPVLHPDCRSQISRGERRRYSGVYIDTPSPIQHVVIVIQENRSFNDLFYGFPGATTATYGYDSSGQKITLQPIVLETTWDIEHDSTGFFESCNGTGSIPGTDCQMNGFNKEQAAAAPRARAPIRSTAMFPPLRRSRTLRWASSTS